MPRHVNLIGQRFGRLTVIEKAESLIDKGGKIRGRWKCKCDCGNECLVLTDTLRAGSTKSCGCYRVDLGKEHILDRTGMRYGNLTVIEQAESLNDKDVYWLCKCDCGNTKIARSANLSSGRTTSCGCKAVLNPDDYIGKKYGRLTIRSKTEDNQDGTNVICDCDCGSENVAIRLSFLKSGKIKSCGCLIEEKGKNLKDNLLGQKFGNLTVIEEAPNYSTVSGKEITQWKCKCDCGNVLFVKSHSLKSGRTKSCGCISSPMAIETRIKKGNLIKNGRSFLRIGHIYGGMKQRCYDPKCPGYRNYGARGIKICDEWLGEKGFETFYEWSKEHGYIEEADGRQNSIDRIDNDGDYSPDNCRWVNNIVQSNNRRGNVFVEYQGEKKTIAEWAREKGITHGALASRIKRGWDIERALTEPMHRNKQKAV